MGPFPLINNVHSNHFQSSAAERLEIENLDGDPNVLRLPNELTDPALPILAGPKASNCSRTANNPEPSRNSAKMSAPVPVPSGFCLM